MNLDIAQVEGKADDKLNDTTAAAQSQLLTGYEGAWIKLRRNNWLYFINKIISMGVAFGFGVITLYLKLMAMKFLKSGDMEAEGNKMFAAAHMQNIMWLMFIYFCMQGMDELIEIFSQTNEMEKGALGLFYEVNHFIGIGLSIYIGWFILATEKPKFAGDAANQSHNRDYKLMYNWLYFQYIWTIFSFLFTIMVACMYRSINKRITRKED